MKNASLILVITLTVSLFSCQKAVEVSKETTYEVVGKAEIIPGNYGDLVNENAVISTTDLLSKLESDGKF